MFITIPNWQKWNPRTDVRIWYRMDAYILREPKLVYLQPLDWVALLYIMGLICANQGRPVELDCYHAQRETGLSEEQFLNALNRIKKSGFCQCTDDAPSVPLKRTNERTYEPDTEALYQLYPKRKGDQGKQRACERIKRQITDQLQYERLKKAIVNYASFCTAECKTGTEYVKQFATFMSCWEEWVERDPPLSSPAALNKWKEIEKCDGKN